MKLIPSPPNFLGMGQRGQAVCETVVSGFLFQYLELLYLAGSVYSNGRNCIIIAH
jgi:hypothetical protein